MKSRKGDFAREKDWAISRVLRPSYRPERKRIDGGALDMLIGLESWWTTSWAVNLRFQSPARIRKTLPGLPQWRYEVKPPRATLAVGVGTRGGGHGFFVLFVG